MLALYPASGIRRSPDFECLGPSSAPLGSGLVLPSGRVVTDTAHGSLLHFLERCVDRLRDCTQAGQVGEVTMIGRSIVRLAHLISQTTPQRPVVSRYGFAPETSRESDPGAASRIMGLAGPRRHRARTPRSARSRAERWVPFTTRANSAGHQNGDERDSRLRPRRSRGMRSRRRSPNSRSSLPLAICVRTRTANERLADAVARHPPIVLPGAVVPASG